MDGITAVLDISTLIYNGAAAENRNTTYIAKGGKLSHNTAALTVELTGSNADDFTFADGANVYTGYVNNVQ